MAMSYEDMLAQMRARIREVSPAEAKELLAAAPDGLVIDVRELHEWDTGHLPGAVHIPLAQLPARANPESPSADPALTAAKDRLIIAQCRTGQRSVVAADALQKLGYTNVASMRGGILLWARSGFPID